MNKTERLEFLISLDPAMKEDCYVEYIPKRGWVLQWSLPRYFYDEGELLGSTYAEAKQFLMKLIRPDIRNWWAKN